MKNPSESIPQVNIKVTKDSWREAFLEVIDQIPDYCCHLDSPSKKLGYILRDLEKMGYIGGNVVEDHMGTPSSLIALDCVTLKGKMFRDDLKEEIFKRSFWGRATSAATLALGWLIGVFTSIFTGYLIYLITKG